MDRRVRFAFLAVSLFASVACKRHIRIDDPQRLEYHPAAADDVRRWRRDLAADLAAGPLSLRAAGDDDASGWTVVTRFVHVSDVQLRDRGIRYFSRKQEKLVSMVASATRRNDDVDSNDEFPFLALVGGINALAQRDPGAAPDFLVHTGDAADANTAGELFRFVAVANELAVPWFEVVGNHDLFLMGNFTEDHLVLEGAAAGVGWVLNRARFMEAHGANGTVPSTHPATEQPASIRVPGSRYHGFDCLDPSCTRCGEVEPALRSYYSVLLRTDPPLRLLMLDTTLPHERVPRIGGGELPAVGASGYVDAEQFRWVQRELVAAHDGGQAVLVFGHHPLTVPRESFGSGPLRGTNPEGRANASVLDLLKSERNVLGYFGGHTHAARIADHADAYRGTYPFYEVIAPSLHEYPQSAFWVEVLRRDDELALRVRPLEPVATANPVILARVNQACAGARAHAKLVRDGACTSGVGIVTPVLAGRVPTPPARARIAPRAGQEVDCGTIALGARATCAEPGVPALRGADAPHEAAAGTAARWARDVTCAGGRASVAYVASCTARAPRAAELTVASTVSARLEAGGAANRRARGEIAPQWTVPLQVPAGGAKVRIAGPPAAQLACRARIDALADTPISEKATWIVESPGAHTVTVTCAPFEASCPGPSPCAAEQRLETTFAVTME